MWDIARAAPPVCGHGYQALKELGGMHERADYLHSIDCAVIAQPERRWHVSRASQLQAT